MSPEFGSTCAIFPIDAETIRYLELTGRPHDQIERVEAYARAQGLWLDADSEDPTYTDVVELDLGDVVPSVAGPRRPQDRVALTEIRDAFRSALSGMVPEADDMHDEEIEESFPASDPPSSASPGHDDALTHIERPHDAPAPSGRTAVQTAAQVALDDGRRTEIDHGHVVISAITSCTNTSNPAVMLAAGLLARNAVARGLEVKPWVKTSLAPGSKVVTEYFTRAGLLEPLETLGFHLVGYGCTTCIGNSGPLPETISAAIEENDIVVCAVLSGNRNFEGRINPDVRMNYLASPPLCVAYALAGTLDWDPYEQPLGQDRDGDDVYLRDIWPDTSEIARTVEAVVRSDMFRSSYADVFEGDENWRHLDAPGSGRYEWDADSTYVRRPPFFEGLSREPAPVTDIERARVLAILGDSVTTDHISPAGAIKE
jgi:aconitate hydratase